MTTADQFLTVAVANVRAFNHATTATQLADRAISADQAYGILDAAEILTQLMPQAFIRLGLAVGQSLTAAGASADIDLVITAAAAHIAEAAQLISDASENIAPLLDPGADDERRRRRPMVEGIRRWVSKAA
ncbi:hypothetical protein DFS55_25360 (plasmid) [Mycobacterium avium subsp. hominissuis]|uniref:Uncharacterized protein n=1 Tax=Mycobacterium avium subsp. hominissuis TaxID=439334 RepID=A0A3B6XG76_MYCAV|nr:hypothetical protein [Mycobacterium avium]AXO25969.1 hypothetical protein DFS55_25360 [Mycobacterium avium subsp. hominissuis]